MQGHCGSGLARDGLTAFCLTHRIVCIASKPAPTVVVVRPGPFPAPAPETPPASARLFAL
ncbi:hypothetical protein EQV96_15570 [Pseudomonas sp. TMW22080]|nr:hypothetical protein [Pseudomonas sp. TMW22080]